MLGHSLAVKILEAIGNVGWFFLLKNIFGWFSQNNNLNECPEPICLDHLTFRLQQIEEYLFAQLLGGRIFIRVKRKIENLRKDCEGNQWDDFMITDKLSELYTYLFDDKMVSIPVDLGSPTGLPPLLALDE